MNKRWHCWLNDLPLLDNFKIPWSKRGRVDIKRYGLTVYLASCAVHIEPLFTPEDSFTQKK